MFFVASVVETVATWVRTSACSFRGVVFVAVGVRTRLAFFVVTVVVIVVASGLRLV